MTKQRLDIANALYYVELKSNGQRTLFPHRSLFGECLQLLSQLHNKTGSSIIGYCFLQSSIHLVLRAGNTSAEAELGAQDSAQTLALEYTKLYNQFHERHGSVFHKYIACVLLEPRIYLADVIKQLHRLPVEQGLVACPSIYPWSSHNGYTGEDSLTWLDTETLLNQLSRQRASKVRRYELFMHATPPEELPLAQGNHEHYRALASDGYIEKLLNAPSQSPPILTPTLAWLRDQVCEEYTLTPQDLALWRRHRLGSEVKSAITLLAQAFGSADASSCADFLQEDQDLLEYGMRSLEGKRQIYLHDMQQRLELRLIQQAEQDPSILQMDTSCIDQAAQQSSIYDDGSDNVQDAMSNPADTSRDKEEHEKETNSFPNSEELA